MVKLRLLVVHTLKERKNAHFTGTAGIPIYVFSFYTWQQDYANPGKYFA